MSNYIEYKDKIAFHPGYYISEIIENSGLTQEDFARRLGTTPKTISILISGSQNLSLDIAGKLSRMLGTSIEYWLNLQNKYDMLREEFILDSQLQDERRVFSFLDYRYFRDNFGLPAFSRNIPEQIRCLRELLGIASLTVLEDECLATSFRKGAGEQKAQNIARANAIVQLAVNKAVSIECPKFNRKKFEKAANRAAEMTMDRTQFWEKVEKEFREAGVVLIVLPNLSCSKVNGATKRLNGKIMLMLTDRGGYEDILWFSLFHEIGHIINGDLGITFGDDVEEDADCYAQNKLIPPEAYEQFIRLNKYYTDISIRSFAESIHRDPGIVLGRLLKEKRIAYTDQEIISRLRHKFIANMTENETNHRLFDILDAEG